MQRLPRHTALARGMSTSAKSVPPIYELRTVSLPMALLLFSPTRFEIVTSELITPSQYHVNPGQYRDFIGATNKHIHLRTAHSPLLGYWATDLGGINEVVHIWEYRTLLLLYL